MTNPDERPPASPAATPSGGLTASIADPAAITGDVPAVSRVVDSQASSQRYVLSDEIAQGGMGVIYRATDKALEREVVVKVLQGKYGPVSGVARRFADEARITAQLQHPAIPPVHDLGTLPDGRPFLAMKLIKGQTLEKLLHARTDVSADRGRFVAVFEQVCQAVAYAHAHGVIHRDLKPANVMVGAYGEVQVMDWGLAKVIGEQPSESADAEATRAGTLVVSLRDREGTFTQAGSVMGTPAYMPPEQAVGAVGKIDQRSDVFGLGAILAVILTGQPPFTVASTETMRVKAAQGRLEECFARLDCCGADPDLLALCKRCLAPEKADRPADASEVANAVALLRAAAEERARQAERERVAAEVRVAEQRKQQWIWCALAMTLLLGTVASIVFAALARQAEAGAVVERDLKEAAREEAVANEEKARIAEAARRQELRRTAAAAAQLAAGRGQWREALRLYETALEGGGGNEIELQLGRYDCRMALGQMRPAVDELDALAARPDLGQFAGPVLLRKAEIAIGMQGGDDLRGLARRALDKGLPPADAAYARVFLVQTAPEAIELLQEAVRLDPFHSPGQPFLTMLLFATGRRDEFREAVTRLRLLAPGSTSHLMSELFLRAMDGDRAGAERTLSQVEKNTDLAELVPLFRGLVDMIVLAQSEDFFFGGVSLQRLARFVSEYARLAQQFSRLAGEKNADKSQIRGMRIFQLPMFQALAETPPIKGLTTGGMLGAMAMFQQPAKMAEVFAAVSRAIPDGTFLLLHGLFLQQAGRVQEAEAVLRRAVESPSWANHRLAARFHLALAQWQLAHNPNARAQDRAAWKEKALVNVRDLAVSGKQPLPPMQTALLGRIASVCGDPVLGLAMTEAALRKTPNDLLLLGSKLDLEIELRVLDRAETTAKVVITRLPAKPKLGGSGYDALLNLARTYNEAGRHSDARRWCDLLHEHLKRDGADDPSLLDSWNRLGVTYWQLKQLDQSIPIFERVFAGLRKSRGERHLTTLRAEANLGVNYRDAGRLKEAIAKLEQVDREGHDEPSLRWVRGELLSAYVASRMVPEGIRLAQEILAETRQEHPADSPALGGALTQVGSSLVQLGAWTRAETVLREALRIRVKSEPDAWTTFNTRSLLGAALAGQKKYADAETLLLKGYEGMKQRENTIPSQGVTRIPEALDRLIEFSTATNKPEEAKKWRAERAKYPLAKKPIAPEKK